MWFVSTQNACRVWLSATTTPNHLNMCKLFELQSFVQLFFFIFYFCWQTHKSSMARFWTTSLTPKNSCLTVCEITQLNNYTHTHRTQKVWNFKNTNLWYMTQPQTQMSTRTHLHSSTYSEQDAKARLNPSNGKLRLRIIYKTNHSQQKVQDSGLIGAQNRSQTFSLGSHWTSWVIRLNAPN